MYTVVGRGWVGNKVLSELTSRGLDAEIVSHEAIDSIDYRNTKAVINCAGVTGNPNVDACEADPIGTIAGNVSFPVMLAAKCEENGVRFIHWSSGCIFEGGPHDEYSKPNFTGSIYSISKAAADIALQKHLVLRIRMPFDGTHHPKNLLVKLDRYARTGKVLDGINSLSDIDEMVSLSVDLMLDGVTGVQHMVNQGSISNREIVEMLGHTNVEWWTQEDFGLNHDAKRSICQLTTRHKTRDVRDALAEAIKEFKR